MLPCQEKLLLIIVQTASAVRNTWNISWNLLRLKPLLRRFAWVESRTQHFSEFTGKGVTLFSQRPEYTPNLP